MKTINVILFSLFIYSSLIADVIDAKTTVLDNAIAESRVLSIEPRVDLPFTTETKRLIDVYTQSYLPGARRIVERSMPYFDQYDFILEQKGLPRILKNIAIVESNMDPWTFSSRGAVGVWQLMRNTAVAHGLIIDKYVDERFDPLLASTVAFNYLKELNQEFQDWNLTLIAYNFGPSALRKAIKTCGSSDYAKIKPHLPKESQKYASRLAAAAYLSEYYTEHLNLDKLNVSDFNLAGIKVYDYITFNEISAITGMNRQNIVKYNPSVTYDYLPSNDIGYTIHLPLKAMIKLAHNKGWDLSDISNFEFHKNQIESLISFHYTYEGERKNEHDQKDNSSDASLAEMLALRREQILRMLSLA